MEKPRQEVHCHALGEGSSGPETRTDTSYPVSTQYAWGDALLPHHLFLWLQQALLVPSCHVVLPAAVLTAGHSLLLCVVIYWSVTKAHT